MKKCQIKKAKSVKIACGNKKHYQTKMTKKSVDDFQTKQCKRKSSSIKYNN